MDAQPRLPDHHPLRSIEAEHAAIERRIDRLDDLINLYRDTIGTDEAADARRNIALVAEQIQSLDGHEEYEARILYPALHKAGVAWPERRRPEIHQLAGILRRHAAHPSLDTEIVVECARELRDAFREHLEITRDAVFPTACRTFPDLETWLTFAEADSTTP